MPNMIACTKWAVAAWLAALAALVFYRLLTGQIKTRGLLCESVGGPVLAERIQLLLLTIGGSGAFVISTLSNGTFPDISDWFVTGVGGSQLLYIVPKFIRMTRGS